MNNDLEKMGVEEIIPYFKKMTDSELYEYFVSCQNDYRLNLHGVIEALKRLLTPKDQ